MILIKLLGSVQRRTIIRDIYEKYELQSNTSESLVFDVLMWRLLPQDISCLIHRHKSTELDTSKKMANTRAAGFVC